MERLKAPPQKQALFVAAVNALLAPWRAHAPQFVYISMLLQKPCHFC